MSEMFEVVFEWMQTMVAASFLIFFLVIVMIGAITFEK